MLVRTGFESRWGQISVAVPVAYLAMLSLWLACRGGLSEQTQPTTRWACSNRHECHWLGNDCKQFKLSHKPSTRAAHSPHRVTWLPAMPLVIMHSPHRVTWLPAMPLVIKTGRVISAEGIEGGWPQLRRVTRYKTQLYFYFTVCWLCLCWLPLYTDHYMLTTPLWYFALTTSLLAVPCTPCLHIRSHWWPSG